MNQTAPRPLLPLLRLPRELEVHDCRETLVKLLASNLRPLWKDSLQQVSQIPITAELENALRLAAHCRQLEVGLENIEKILNREKKGLAEQGDDSRSALRLSRLLLITNDGSQRFYRACEKILFDHSNRIRILRVDVSSVGFLHSIYGADRAVKAFLISKRQSVCSVLLSLVSGNQATQSA